MQHNINLVYEIKRAVLCSFWIHISHAWRNVIQIGLKENVRLKRHIISMQNTQNEHKP